MSKFSGFLFKKRRGLLFILLIIVSVILMLTTNKNAVITGKKIAFSFAYPFQFTITSVGNFIQNTINSISQLNKLQQELNKTRTELEQYKKVIIDFNELNNEIISLRKLLELTETIDYELVACEVIGRNPKKMNEMLLINKGTTSGIKENMPVISYAGGKRALVGKIFEATPFASKVITLNNPKMSVGAIITRNRINCLVKGNNENQDMVNLLYIPKGYNISTTGDDFVYTSGDSVIFPRGLEIGKIVNIKHSERYENFNEAEVKITAELSKLEYLLVLKIDAKSDNYKLLELPQ